MSTVFPTTPAPGPSTLAFCLRCGLLVLKTSRNATKRPAPPRSTFHDSSASGISTWSESQICCCSCHHLLTEQRRATFNPTRPSRPRLPFRSAIIFNELSRLCATSHRCCCCYCCCAATAREFSVAPSVDLGSISEPSAYPTTTIRRFSI